MRKNQFLAVVHVVSNEQAFRNVGIALDNGADGVFLINHDVRGDALAKIYHQVTSKLDDNVFVGVNFLGASPFETMQFLASTWCASALWMDDIGYLEGENEATENTARPRKIQNSLRWLSYRGSLFGGVAFKYQRPVSDLVRVTRGSAPFVDVITTSGARTGSAPDIEKIRIMRDAVPDAKLAIASGMTPENVDPFLDLADYFLVATGVSDSHTELNPARVRLMAEKMRR